MNQKKTKEEFIKERRTVKGKVKREKGKGKRQKGKGKREKGKGKCPFCPACTNE